MTRFERIPRIAAGAIVLAAMLAGMAGCTAPGGEEKPRTLPADAIATDTPDKTTKGDQRAEGADLGDDSQTETLKEPEIYPGSGEFVGETRTRAEAGKSAGGYTLNFAGADLREVVDAVLGETLGVNYSIHKDVSGTVTARTARPLTREQVVPALEDILAMNGAAIVEKSGMYHVVPLEKARTPPPVTPEDRGASGYGMHIIPVNYVSASALKDNLQKFVTPGRTLRVDRVRNLLLFIGPGSEADDLAEMVDLFDVDWMKGKSFALLPLDSAAPGKVVSELRSIFGRQRQDGGGPDALRGVIRFLPIERMNAVLVITKQRAYLDRARRWVERLDRGVAQQERKLFVYDVKNTRAQHLARVLGRIFTVQVSSGSRRQRGTVAPGRQAVSLSSGGGSNSTGSGTGATASAADSGTTAGGSSGGGTGATASAADSGTTAGGSSGGGSTFGRSASGAGSAFGGRQNGGRIAARGGAPANLGKGRQPRIIADTRNNALLILATGEQYRMIRSTLERLDKVPLQVVIEATIAEVRLQDELQYGLRFFFENDSGGTTGNITFSDLGSGGVAQTFPGFSFLLESGDTRGVLNALSDVSDVNVISSPHLMVLNHQSASIQVGDEVPVATRSAQSTTDPDAPVVNQIEFRNTGTILEVSPHVNESGLVTLDIRQEVSDVTQTTTSGLNSPTIQQREIKSTVAVQSGETIALGGLIEDSKDRSVVGVPLLKDIPYVGNAFKNVTVTKNRTELLVLLTPRVVHNQQEAEQITRELRRRLQGVKMFREKTPDREAPAEADSQSGASSAGSS